MVALARDCGLSLIAEGLETQAQADLLTACGERVGQGYLCGRPVPVAVPLVAAVAAG